MTSLQNLFVAKLPRNLTDTDLEQIFSGYGPESAKIMLDATTGKSKGFGFVLFDSEEKGEKAYKALNKTHVTVHGHAFHLAIFPSKHDGKVANEVSQCLYIRNLPKQLSQAEVEEFLRKFGKLTYCAMREDHHGSPVWVVYAEYDTIDDAKNALTKLHGSRSYFEDSPVAILAKYADSDEAKKERRRRREQQQPQTPNGAQGGGGGHTGHSQAIFNEGDSAPSPVPPPPHAMVANGTPPPPPPHAQPYGYVTHHSAHKGYSSHFYKDTGMPSHGMARMPTATNASGTEGNYPNNSTGGSATDLYMPIANDGSSEGQSNGVQSEEMLLPYTATPQQQQQQQQQQQPQLGPHTGSFGGFGSRAAPPYGSGPVHRFAPANRTPVQANNGMSVRNASFESANTAASNTHGSPLQHPHQQMQPPTVADVPMNMRSYGESAGLTAQGGGAAGLGASTNNPTPLSQSFLGVTFPTTTPVFEQGSNERGSPMTPLEFQFDENSDAAMRSQPSGSMPVAQAPLYGERTPVRVPSNLSTKSLTTGTASGARYRHNPYAPVTPISSTRTSPGPSTPRVTTMNAPNGNGQASSFVNHPSYPTSPQQPITVTTHFGHSHTNSGTGVAAGPHFANATSNSYLGVPDGRTHQQP